MHVTECLWRVVHHGKVIHFTECVWYLLLTPHHKDYFDYNAQCEKKSLIWVCFKCYDLKLHVSYRGTWIPIYFCECFSVLFTCLKFTAEPVGNTEIFKQYLFSLCHCTRNDFSTMKIWYILHLWTDDNLFVLDHELSFMNSFLNGLSNGCVCRVPEK